VLSNLLLTVVAVAAMSIAATAAYVISDNLHNSMGERLLVEDVWFKPNDQIALYIRNVGKVDVNIASVYVNQTPMQFTSLRLEAGEHGWLNVTCSWVSGDVYHIVVATRRGTKVGDYYVAP